VPEFAVLSPVTASTRKRIVRHTLLALGSTLAVLGVFAALDFPPFRFGLSMGTAYVSLTLFVGTLVIGPANVIWGRANPVSTHLRRDIGIWSGITGLVHLVVGLQAHFPGEMWKYFLFPADVERVFRLRYDAFGVANWTGLLSGVILALLLGLSNDYSLRRLGSGRWKSIQRWSYWTFLLLIVHGALYQLAIGSRHWGWKATLGISVLVAGVVQATGFRAVRRTKSRRESP
jgi:methionine sulfoxide reductase heme-binding subunit